MSEINLNVSGMTCGSCVKHVTSALKALDGVGDVNVDLAAGKVKVTRATDEDVPLQAMAVGQESNPYKTTRLLLDGQQRLTSLSAMIRGEPVNVRGRKRPIEILFNLEHPNELQGFMEINEESDVDDTEPDQEDASEDELQQRFDQMTFVVSTRKLYEKQGMK